MTERPDGVPVGWNLSMIGVGAAWDRGLTGRTVVVGHLDTGVDADHPALTGRLSTCRVFDVGGRALERATMRVESDHGTFMAGIVCGAASGGFSGIAPDAALASAAVLEHGDVVARVLAGFDWLMGLGVRATLFSGGLPEGTRVLDRTIEECWARGMLVMCPTGNAGTGHVMVPADHPLTLAVGAVDSTGAEPSFSGSTTIGTRIAPDVFAPGVDVLGPVPGGGWATKTGTSAAAAHVAGVAALLLEARPDATASELRAALTGATAARPGIVDAEAGLDAIGRSPDRARMPAVSTPGRAIEERLLGQLGRDDPGRGRTAVFVFRRDAPNRGMRALDDVARAHGSPWIELRHLAEVDTYVITAPAAMIRTLCAHHDVEVAGAPNIHSPWPGPDRQVRSIS